MASREEIDRNAQGWLDRLIEQGAKAPHAGFYEITPARARAMLGRNSDNRNLRRHLISKLREDILADRWQVNGESMVFSIDGLLNDGQHRLHAINEAGKAVTMVVAFGVTRESRLTLDLGAGRSASDVLHFLGVQNATTAASVARLILAFEKSGGKTLEARHIVSKPMIVERAHEDRRLNEMTYWAVTQPPDIKHLIPASPLAFCRYVLSAIDEERSANFLRGLCEGTNLPKGAPALAVRRYLYTIGNRHPEAKIAMVLRGWVHFVQGISPEAGAIHGRFPLPGIGVPFGDGEEVRPQ